MNDDDNIEPAMLSALDQDAAALEDWLRDKRLRTVTAHSSAGMEGACGAHLYDYVIPPG